MLVPEETFNPLMFQHSEVKTRPGTVIPLSDSWLHNCVGLETWGGREWEAR